MANTINTSSLTVKRVAGGRAWYQVLDRDGNEMSSGWQRIAWRGEWMQGGNAAAKPAKIAKKRVVYRTKS
jgi:hypothetical protein